MNTTMNESDNHVILEVRGNAGLITLKRAKALNALSLPMIRQITAALLDWRAQAAIKCVAIRGTGKDAASPSGSSPFGAFCAGGDIRFFHQAVLAGNPELEDFFTEEYALNHLVHTYPKPYIAFMDGIVMGGGMGLAQGASHRIVTERTKMAMPETGIGLFPDVGGGYFLSRCPGRVGEYLALTGKIINDAQAVVYGLASFALYAESLPQLWESLATTPFLNETEVNRAVQQYYIDRMQFGPEAQDDPFERHRRDFNEAFKKLKPQIDHFFALPTVLEIVRALEADTSDWARETAAILRKRSPLMLHVVLEQIRRARSMSLADNLRIERSMVRHCFHTQHLNRSGTASETVEGIRALVVDKDHKPKWNPARIEDVMPGMVQAFFVSPWPTAAHPLQNLA